MGDGIKYVFEVEGAAPGMEALNAKLEASEKLLPKVKEHSEAAGRAHDKHGAHAKGLEGVLHHLVTAGLDPFLHKAKEIAEFEFIRRGIDALIEAPAEIIDKLKELGEEMVNVVAKTERTNTSFKLLFGAEQGSEVLEYIESIAGATEFTDGRLKAAAQTLAKVGFEGQKLNRALAASLDISAFSPDKESGFGEALASLERIKRTGHVDNRVLGGLGIGQDAFFKELSVRTGEGIAELKKKIETGKVDANEALESLYSLIARKTGKDLGGAGVEVGKGLESRLTHLKDLPEQFFQKLAGGQAQKRFTGFIDNLGKMLDPESEKGQKLLSALEKSATTLVNALSKIDIGHELMVAVAVLEKLPRLIELATRALEAFGFAAKAAAGPLVPLLGVAALATPKERTELKSMANQALFGKTSEELNKMSFFERLGVGAKGAVKTVGGMLSSPFRDHSIGAGMAEGMKADTPLVEGAATKLGDAAVDSTRKAIDAHSPSRKFAELGRMSTAGYAAGIEASIDGVDDVVSGAFAVPAPQGGRVAAIGGAPVVVTFGDIIITVPGGSASSAEQIGQVARAVFRDELLEAIEGLRTEGGV